MQNNKIDKRKIKVNKKTGDLTYIHDNKEYALNVFSGIYIPDFKEYYKITSWNTFHKKGKEELFLTLNRSSEYDIINQIVIALRDKAYKVFGQYIDYL